MDEYRYAIEVYDNTNENNRKGMWYTRIFDLDKRRYYDTVSKIMAILSQAGEEKQDWDFEIPQPIGNKITFTLRLHDTESGQQLSRSVHHILEGLRLGIYN